MSRAEDLADAAADQLRRDIERTAANLLRWLREKVGDRYDTLDRAHALAIGQELGEQLGRLGFQDASQRVLTSFEWIAAQVRRDLRSELGASFTSVSLDGLRPLVSRVARGLIVQQGLAGARAREVLFAMVAAGRPREDALQAVAEAARAKLGRIVTEVATSFHAFLREGLVSQAEASGIDLFTYGGPDDEVTRPFCADHVHKVYTSSDLDEEDNGQDLAPTSRFLGGYGCRHRLEPISVTAARALPAHRIGGREARAIVKGIRLGRNEAVWVARNRGKVVGGKIVRARARAAG